MSNGSSIKDPVGKRMEIDKNHRLERSGGRPIKKIPLKGALLSSFIVMTLLPVLAIGLFSYHGFKEVLAQKISQYSLDGLNQTVVNIQLKLAEFENTSVRLFINKGFNTAVYGYTTSKNPSQTALEKQEIESYFNEYMISNNDIFAFMIMCDTYPGRSFAVAKDNYEAFQKLTHHLKTTTTYQNIRKAGGGIVWSTSIKLGLDHYVVLGREIKNMADGEPLGVLAIIIDEEQIDRLTNLNVYNRLNISFNDMENYSIVINSDGEIVSSPYKDDIGKNISKLMKNTKPLKGILGYAVSDRDYGSEVNQGSFITEVNHKQTLVTYKTIGSKIGVGGKSSWHMLNLTSTASLYERVKKLGVMMTMAGMIFGIIAALVASVMTAYIQKNKISIE